MVRQVYSCRCDYLDARSSRTYAYDDLGRRSSVTRGNGVIISVTYDGLSRLTSLDQDMVVLCCKVSVVAGWAARPLQL